MWPPFCLRIPWTTDKPNPVPFARLCLIEALARTAADGFIRRADVDDAPLFAVPNPKHFADIFRQLLEAFLTVTQARLGLFALRDVPGDFGGANDPTVAVPDGRDGQRDVDEPPVLPAAYGLKVADALAALQPGEDLSLLAGMVRRDEQRHRPA